jgi:hypothetical protein
MHTHVTSRPLQDSFLYPFDSKLYRSGLLTVTFSGTCPFVEAHDTVSAYPMNVHLAFCACPFIAALRTLYLILGHTHPHRQRPSKKHTCLLAVCVS